MPRFFGHMHTPAGIEVDRTGLEFPSFEAAYLAICQCIMEIMSEADVRKILPERCWFEITDAAGRCLMKVPFAEAVEQALRALRDAARR
ncbi:DUF6894 family protein [Methylobacterium durans]|uniref:DUF6894 domain-containing protein n=1 Tax=Methylobacterium durans TaxID=2202825 RepID=A0A2U8W9D9_9HYPH|nr:hypothetical protein [Methylobacterium durans]AWN42754.1 hypothetical protein DK389_22435 [Methylobacterium durans]